MKWVTSRIVTPLDRISEMRSQTSRRAPVERCVQVEGLADPDLVRQLAVLQLHADQLVMVTPRVPAKHAEHASVRGTQAGDAFHRRGLPGAVRPEDAEDLSGLNRERDIFHRDLGPVLLAKATDFNDWHASSIRRTQQPRHRPAGSILGGAGGTPGIIRSVDATATAEAVTSPSACTSPRPCLTAVTPPPKPPLLALAA
jgi:hypothetical protein